MTFQSHGLEQRGVENLPLWNLGCLHILSKPPLPGLYGYQKDHNDLRITKQHCYSCYPVFLYLYCTFCKSQPLFCFLLNCCLFGYWCDFSNKIKLKNNYFISDFEVSGTVYIPLNSNCQGYTNSKILIFTFLKTARLRDSREAYHRLLTFF